MKWENRHPFRNIYTRAKDGQKEMSYLIGSSRDQDEAARLFGSNFWDSGLEVIYFTDPRSIIMSPNFLDKFNGKKLVSVDRAGVNIRKETYRRMANRYQPEKPNRSARSSRKSSANGSPKSPAANAL